jgi:protein TonB
MMSLRPYQWPIILSVFLHASIFVAGMVMADLIAEPERPKPAATTSINITMNASKPFIEQKAEEKPEPEPKIEKAQEPKPKSEKEPVIETVSASKPAPVLAAISANKPEPVVEEKPISEKKIQEVQQDEQPEVQQPEFELEQAQQEANQQEFSNEALIIHEQMVGQQVAQQTANAEAQYQDQILNLIESNKFYPKRAKKMRQEGDVIVMFTLNRDGSLQGLKVLDETAPSLLRRAALKAIRLSALFPQFPADSVRRTWSFTYKLKYSLYAKN